MAGQTRKVKTRKTKKTRKVKKIYWPPKYYKGLTRKKALERKKEIQKFGSLSWKNKKAYTGFKTDKGIKTKPSSYTEQWNSLFPEAKSLQERADVTGVPLEFIEKCFNRGAAAWRTGHRPGASREQWGYARVSSLLLCGKTHYSTDSDLVREAVSTSSSAKKWFSRCPATRLTR